MADTTRTAQATPCVIVLGTCDTKLEELLYVRTKLLDGHHVRVTLIDVGRTPSTDPAVDISQRSVLAHPTSCSPSPSRSAPDISSLTRAELISTLAAHAGPLLASLIEKRLAHGLIALGGSGGSSLAGAVMRHLPLGFPKLLVSTMAAGDVSPYVGEMDVSVLYSVVDIAGLNDILCPILDNAAGAIAGMARAYHARLSRAGAQRKRIAITMFGVTTPAVTTARELLAQYPCTSYVFHATGAGGRALERLIAEGFFDGVLDLTTTELADELVGGVLSAGPHRLEAASRAGIPQVISMGALDMVNFGPRSSVPERFVVDGRKLYEHNPSVTLMRTTRDECAQLGRIIAEKLRKGGARPEMTEVWVPKGGVSALDKEGEPFRDVEADEALIHALSEALQGHEEKSRVRMVERNEHVNDPAFVEGMVHSLLSMMQLR
ncbi:UPF0261 domain protein [Trametes polyzona]|nr:UPF0261 domain protein [Trametes polyzona]